MVRFGKYCWYHFPLGGPVLKDKGFSRAAIQEKVIEKADNVIRRFFLHAWITEQYVLMENFFSLS